MTAMMTEKLEALMGEEELVKNLVACATEEEARAMLAAEGIELTDEDWSNMVAIGIVEHRRFQSDAELTEEDMEKVFGGKTVCGGKPRWGMAFLCVIGSIVALEDPPMAGLLLLGAVAYLNGC